MAVYLRRFCAAIVLLACTAAVSPHATSTVALLDVPGIQGTVTTKGYAGWITLQSYTLGIAVNGRPQNAVASPVVFQKRVDATSPLFAQAYFANTPFKGTTKLYALTSTSHGIEPAIEVELHDATVVSDTTATGSDGPLESISLSYDAIRYCVAPAISGQAQVCQAWNFKTNSPTYPAN